MWLRLPRRVFPSSVKCKVGVFVLPLPARHHPLSLKSIIPTRTPAIGARHARWLRGNAAAVPERVGNGGRGPPPFTSFWGLKGEKEALGKG